MSIRKLFFYALFFGLFGCTSSDRLEYERAQEEIEKKNYKEAIKSLKRVVLRSGKKKIGIESSAMVAQIFYYQIKDFKEAAKYYKHLVLYSQNEKSRVEAQKQIAKIFFQHLNDYDHAIIEYSRLLEMPHSESEEAQYKLFIAKSYYYLSNFFQSEVEANSILKGKISEELRFATLLLKGNIYLAQKTLKKAVGVFADMIEKYPKKSQGEKIHMNLVLCYEELKEYEEAIAILEGMKAYYSEPDYIDFRIQRLKHQLANMPGRRGLKK